MSRRLYLLRHAKSSWDDPGLADHDRPLARRGARAAKAIARHLDEQRIAPDLVLCSTARRAAETLEAIRPALGAASIRHEDELYGAEADDLLARVRGVDDEVGALMLVGHNPAIEELALGLARPSPLRDEVAAKFPTGALATLTIAEGSWGDLAPGAADLVAFVRPRDLER